MDPVQLILIAVGLLAIAAGSVALVVALFTLRPGSFGFHTGGRAGPKQQRSAPPSDPAPTLEQLRSPPQPVLKQAHDEEDGDDEDQIATAVLRVGDYEDLDAMIAAVDELERGGRG